jgi:sugar lactone lactonase YvrE
VNINSVRNVAGPKMLTYDPLSYEVTYTDYSSGSGGTGDTGATGDTGPGLIPGGSSGQMLVKASNNDYDTRWENSINIYGYLGYISTYVSGLNYPNGIALDSSNNLYIAETLNNRIRKVDSSGNISTVAGIVDASGSPLYGYSGDGDLATLAELANPIGLALDSSNNLYIVDQQNYRIRKVTTSTGIITTIAGTGVGGYSGDGGPATSAQIDSEANSVAVDNSGNLYIADSGNNRIRKVDSSGIITTVAGNGEYGFSGDGGLAINAKLAYPFDIAIDRSNNLYIADTVNNVIRKVDSYGYVTTVAGTLDASGIPIAGYSGDGGIATLAQLYNPKGIGFDSKGNLYIGDTSNHRIRKVDYITGIITKIAGTTSGYSGDAGLATSAQLFEPIGIIFDSSANLYIADTVNNVIRKISYIQTVNIDSVRNASGPKMLTYDPATYEVTYTDNPLNITVSNIIKTIAGNGEPGYSGDGGPAISASFNIIQSIVFNDRIIYVVHTNSTSNSIIRRIDTDYNINTDYTINIEIDSTYNLSEQVYGTAFDASGYLYIADSGNNVIKKIDIQDTYIMTTVAGTGTAGFSGDGGPATSAKLNYPGAIALDSSNNLYIADTYNHLIRKVDYSTQIISTVVGYIDASGVPQYGWAGSIGYNIPALGALLRLPVAIVFNKSNDMFISDLDNNVIFKVDNSTSIISIICGDFYNTAYSGDGGLATSAGLNGPYGLALDKSGNLYIADSQNNRIRKINNSTGIITTVAGNGASTYDISIGDGGLATSAELNQPFAIVLDTSDNLYIAEATLVIRKVESVSTYPVNYIPSNASNWQSPVPSSLGGAVDTLVDTLALYNISTITSINTLTNTFGTLTSTAFPSVIYIPDTLLETSFTIDLLPTNNSARYIIRKDSVLNSLTFFASGGLQYPENFHIHLKNLGTSDVTVYQAPNPLSPYLINLNNSNADLSIIYKPVSNYNSSFLYIYWNTTELFMV